MPTANQDREFKEMIIEEVDFNVPNSILDYAIEWIGKNLDPEDVFDTKDLEMWAESSGYKKE